ncbi:hypothetical protein [Helicobacter pylori]|uniref:Uncharacterized protein n=1 Tax=Helicobacter pylori TaxID=210 RepID=A0A1A9H885_HELPX|nr:hypothetical protein [Helicobacter pylori]ANH46808.1 hypothetical protein AA973_02845 [Helicobacter pylori]
MDKNRNGYAVITNVMKSLEMGGPFGPMDRSKFVQFARVHGISDSVIEEIVDIIQTINLIHHYEDRLDGSDLERKEKKAVRAELQKSIDENLEVLRKIINI